jgi:hypothetical protein
MAGDNRRPEHPICNNTDEQEDRNHDRRNEVFHGLSFVRRTGSVVPVGVISLGIPAHGRRRAGARAVSRISEAESGLSRSASP